METAEENHLPGTRRQRSGVCGHGKGGLRMEGRYEDIMRMASKEYREWQRRRGPGQVVMAEDGLDYWVAKVAFALGRHYGRGDTVQVHQGKRVITYPTNT